MVLAKNLQDRNRFIFFRSSNIHVDRQNISFTLKIDFFLPNLLQNTSLSFFIVWRRQCYEYCNYSSHFYWPECMCFHYSDVKRSAMVSQIIGVSIVCSAICSGADQRKHQSSASLAFVRRIHRWPVDSHQKGAVTQMMFPFDDVIMCFDGICCCMVLAVFAPHCTPFQCVANGTVTRVPSNN